MQDRIQKLTIFKQTAESFLEVVFSPLCSLDPNVNFIKHSSFPHLQLAYSCLRSERPEGLIFVRELQRFLVT